MRMTNYSLDHRVTVALNHLQQQGEERITVRELMRLIPLRRLCNLRAGEDSVAVLGAALRWEKRQR